MSCLILLQELLNLQQPGLTHQPSISSVTAPLKWAQNATLRRPAAETAKQALLESALRNPQSVQARHLIAAAYGIAPPASSLSACSSEPDLLAAAAALQTGPCAKHGMLLNRYSM